MSWMMYTACYVLRISLYEEHAGVGEAQKMSNTRRPRPLAVDSITPEMAGVATGPQEQPRQRVCEVHSGGHQGRLSSGIQVFKQLMQMCRREHGFSTGASRGSAGLPGKGMCGGVGPFPREAFPGIQVSRFGVIPKRKTGKWWLILDLSSPEGASVNDGIDPVVCSLSYVSVDDVARAVVEAGRGAFLAKTSSRFTGWYQCTWRIGSCWGWYERTVCLSTQHSLLAYAPPQNI